MRSVVDSLRGAESTPFILAMGDFNDEPDNASLREVLGAHTDLLTPPDALGNCMGLMDAEGGGTYNYRGNWNMLDQFVVSGSLMPFNSTAGWQIGSVEAFREDWMMYFSDRFGATPSRTFGGPNYYAGYSDHLPIVATLYRFKP
jgi:predicted extracellular nuclease